LQVLKPAVWQAIAFILNDPIRMNKADLTRIIVPQAATSADFWPRLVVWRQDIRFAAFTR
jgi:hypothetical protein